jgi:rare lipoprotein A
VEARHGGDPVRALIAALLSLALASAARAETCRASWYGTESGHFTANGERFNPRALTAAHRSIAFGTMIGVRAGNHKITLRVTDRGPAAWTGRCLDVSERAAELLGFKAAGTAIVTIERR